MKEQSLEPETKTEVTGPKKLAEEMQQVAMSHDVEVRHIEADRHLCRVLQELGYEEAIEIYKKIMRWYA